MNWDLKTGRLLDPKTGKPKPHPHIISDHEQLLINRMLNEYRQVLEAQAEENLKKQAYLNPLLAEIITSIIYPRLPLLLEIKSAMEVTDKIRAETQTLVENVQEMLVPEWIAAQYDRPFQNRVRDALNEAVANGKAEEFWDVNPNSLYQIKMEALRRLQEQKRISANLNAKLAACIPNRFVRENLSASGRRLADYLKESVNQDDPAPRVQGVERIKLGEVKK